MTGADDIAVVPAILISVLLVGGAAITLIGALGLLRLQTFYERVHAPTLASTLGTVFIATASMIYFSALESRPVLHEWLIIVFITVTTPIGLIVLVGAAKQRDNFERAAGISSDKTADIDGR